MNMDLLLLPFALLLTTCKKDTVQAPDSTYPQQGVFTINKNVRELDLATASLLIEVDSAFLLFQGINSAPAHCKLVKLCFARRQMKRPMAACAKW